MKCNHCVNQICDASVALYFLEEFFPRLFSPCCFLLSSPIRQSEKIYILIYEQGFVKCDISRSYLFLDEQRAKENFIRLICDMDLFCIFISFSEQSSKLSPHIRLKTTLDGVVIDFLPLKYWNLGNLSPFLSY